MTASWAGLAWLWSSMRNSPAARIGAEVDGGVDEAAHEAAGVVTAAQGFAGEMDEGGLAAVGDELNGVDEVSAPGS